MAILQNTLIGRAKRSIGGVTFMTWKGLNVGKSKPVSVANPRSPKQIMRRSVITQLVAVFRFLPAAVDIGFKNQAIHMSPYNAFVGANAINAFTLTAPPVATLVPAEMVFSKGTIAATPIESLVSNASDESTTFSFASTVTGPGQSVSDLATVVLRNNTKDIWYEAVNVAARSTGTVVVTAADFNIDDEDEVVGFLFFKSSTTTAVSDSVEETTVVTT